VMSCGRLVHACPAAGADRHDIGRYMGGHGGGHATGHTAGHAAGHGVVQVEGAAGTVAGGDPLRPQQEAA